MGLTCLTARQDAPEDNLNSKIIEEDSLTDDVTGKHVHCMHGTFLSELIQCVPDEGENGDLLTAVDVFHNPCRALTFVRRCR